LARLYHYLEPVGFVLILLLLYTGVLWAIVMPLYEMIVAFLLG
jgi:hypothetical protein